MDRRIINFLIPKGALEKVFLFGFLYLLIISCASKLFPSFGRELFHVVPFLSVFFILYCLLFTFTYVLTMSFKFLKSVIVSKGGGFISLLYLIAGLSGIGTAGIVGWRSFQSPMWERSRRLFENYHWHDYAFWACGLLFITLYAALGIWERKVNATN